ncbi:MAG: haloacid dehalogenase-like hydrolase, partial [Bacteroidales bacterium]|nr:haloacid dehalogenase-like hydrolase [Bacteroidales bacterium]
DIPSMKVVKDHGGHSIAVYKPGDEAAKNTAVKLIKEERVNFACPANYREGKMLDKLTRRILDKIAADNEFERLEKINQRRYNKQ